MRKNDDKRRKAELVCVAYKTRLQKKKGTGVKYTRPLRLSEVIIVRCKEANEKKVKTSLFIKNNDFKTSSIFVTFHKHWKPMKHIQKFGDNFVENQNIFKL